MDEPENQSSGTQTRIAKAGSLMAGALFLSRVLGMLRDTAIAYTFGITIHTEAYRLALSIPDFLFMLIAGGGLSSAFIPVFSELYYTHNEAKAWKLFSVVANLVALVVTTLILVANVFAEQIVTFMARDKAQTIPDQFISFVGEATHIGRILLPAQFAFLVGSVLLGTLYARKNFAAAALAPNLYNLGIIVGAVIIPKVTGGGIESIAWGAVLGACVGNLLLPIFAMRKMGSSYSLTLDVKAEGVSKFFKLFAPVVFGFSLPSMVTIIMTKFAAGYGETSNTVIAQANNLMQAPLGIFGQSLALAAFPVLAQCVAEGNMDGYRRQVQGTLKTVLYLSIPAAVCLGALGKEIVLLLMGYGKANNNPAGLLQTAQLLGIFSLGIVAWCLQPVLMRGFFSLHKTLKPVAMSTVMTVIYIVALSLTKESPLGLSVVPWVTNIVAWMLAVVLFVGLESEVGSLDLKGLLSTAGKSTVAVIPAGLVAWLGSSYVPHDNRLANAVLTFFLLCVCGWIYFFGTRALKMRESEYLARAFSKLNRGRGQA